VKTVRKRVIACQRFECVVLFSNTIIIQKGIIRFDCIMTIFDRLFGRGDNKDGFLLKGKIEDTNRLELMIHVDKEGYITFFCDPSRFKPIKGSRKDIEFFNRGASLACNSPESLVEGLKYYNHALEENPEFIQAWYNKGLLLIGQLDCKNALTCFDKALELIDKLNFIQKKGFDTYFIWAIKGMNHYALNEKEQALKCIDEALKINPDYREARTYRKIITSKSKIRARDIFPGNFN